MFFSAGLGDAVLLIPLIKQLKAQNFWLSGFFTSPHACEDIFYQNPLLDEVLVKKDKSQQMAFSLTHIHSFDIAFVNYFAATKINLFCAALMGHKINTHKEAFPFFRKKINYIVPQAHLHDAQQNMRLLVDNSSVSLSDFEIPFVSKQKKHILHPYVVVQISAGNGKAPYKNWPSHHWIEFLNLFAKKYPEQKLMLLGDENETALSDSIIQKMGKQVHSFVGKTNISEVMQLIHQSLFFIGLDGGLMHLAVALGKPTFTIWGGSSTVLYGYEQFSSKHKCVSLHLPCGPCNAWIAPNASRVANPNQCPDFACLQQLHAEKVFAALVPYIETQIGAL